MRVVFMGTPDFAAETLRAVLEAGHEVAAVVTQPDKPVGRKAVLTAPPVKELAVSRGIPVLQPRRVREEGFFELLQGYAPDVIVVAAFGQIIPKNILEMPEYGCLNVHASLLPKYRGAAPIQWAILDGETETGVSIMQMNEGLDTGDILTVREVPIGEKETGGSLFDKLAQAGAELLVSTLAKLGTGELHPEKQPEESPTAYARMLKKEDGRIDWTRPASAIERRVRGLYPWPGAWTTLEGKMLKIWSAETVSAECGGTPGAAADAEGELLVQTGNASLRILELQLEGKRRMTAEEFLKGRAIAPGTVLGA